MLPLCCIIEIARGKLFRFELKPVASFFVRAPHGQRRGMAKENLRLTEVNSLAVLGVAVELEVVGAAVGDRVAVYLRYAKNRRRAPAQRLSEGQKDGIVGRE